MPGALLEVEAWSKRRRRAEELAQRWPFAAEVLAFYAALLALQERAFLAALGDAPQPSAVAPYAAERVLPGIVELSTTSGPRFLAAAVIERYDEIDLVETLAAWLRGEPLPAVERYLARAATAPILEALGNGAGAACTGPSDARHCPVCGGIPQVGYFAPSPEDLVTAHRYLVCARCAAAWAYPRLTCAACGETDSAKLPVYGELGTTQAELSAGNVVKSEAVLIQPAVSARFPHVRIDGCVRCGRYLLTIDLERDPAAVPLVDEIAAIPLALYANQRGLTKLVPNMMGF
jgi:FdhE protein